MGGIKSEVTIELNEDQITWLKTMTEKFGIFDEDKSLRICLDYLIDEADEETVFTETRCNRCSDTTNQD